MYYIIYAFPRAVAILNNTEIHINNCLVRSFMFRRDRLAMFDLYLTAAR